MDHTIGAVVSSDYVFFQVKDKTMALAEFYLLPSEKILFSQNIPENHYLKLFEN